jgi:hypothetical protein
LVKARGLGAHLALHDGHHELVRAAQMVGRQAGGLENGPDV